ncbi:MAG: division/cell wall cluster transcriptional repressor MraZ [Verrucomicrobiota bacterium]
MSTTPPAIVYSGEYDHRLDARNRVTVPSSWRVPGDEGNYYFAWPHPEGCIAVFPPAMLDALNAKAAALRVGNSKGNRLLRAVYGRGSHFGCDKQGRILLPRPLMEHAGVDKAVSLVGLGRYFEVWNTETFRAQEEENFDMLGAMQELDI